MVIGYLSYLKDDETITLSPKSVSIEGDLYGLIANIKIIQEYQSDNEIKELSYVFSTDQKFCIYKTSFVIGDKVIDMKLQEKQQAEEAYQKAKDEGKVAAISKAIPNGLSSFTIGNLPKGVICKSIVYASFEANLENSKTVFIKFPLESMTQTKKVTNLFDFKDTNYSFTFNIKQNQKIEKVTTNAKYNYEKIDDKNGKLIINSKTEDNSALLIRTCLEEKFESIAIKSKKGTAICFTPDLEKKEIESNEYVFLVDCSGSMSGKRIENARNCMDIFIRSLPIKCKFNIIKFGSKYKSLFEKIEPYSETNVQIALDLIQETKADMGGTNILSALTKAVEDLPENKVRQIFILTDGEVYNSDEIYNLLENNKNSVRCFTIGIGRGADSGLVERMASITNGKADFVEDGDDLSMKVIPQLELSLSEQFQNSRIEIEGTYEYETSPYPIPPILPETSKCIYLNIPVNTEHILISGKYLEEGCDFIISVLQDDFDNDSIFALFSYQALRQYGYQKDTDGELKKKSISISLESGVLCNYTSFVGIAESEKVDERMMYHAPKMCCCCAAPPTRATPMMCKKSVPQNKFKGIFSRLFNAGKTSRNQSPPDQELIIECDYDESFSNSNSKETKKEEAYSFNIITSLQNIHGYWEKSGALLEHSGFDKYPDIPEIKEINDHDKAKATILALAILHKRSLSQKPSWNMIERKSLNYLRTLSNSVQWETIIQRIADTINK